MSAVVLACAALLLSLVMGHDQAAQGAPVAQSHQDDGLPDPAAVVDAFLRVRRWVDTFAPPALDDPDASIAIGNATGVCVILRNSGRVVGTGTATLGGSSSPELLVRRAAGRAMGEVLGDPAFENLPEDRKSEIGRALTLELEVAGRWQPLLGRSFDQVAQQIEPGLTGAAMRRGADRAMLFPSQLHAVGAAGNIRSRLPGLAVELGLVPTELATLQQRHAVTMHRFPTTHLAQQHPSQMLFETFRGDTLVMLSDVTDERIAAFADGIVAHVLTKMWVDRATEPGEVGVESEPLALGLMGDYDANTGVYQPIVAPPLDQALVSVALLRYAALDDEVIEFGEQARAAAARLLRELETVESGEIDPLSDPAACAAIVLAVAAMPELAEQDPAIELLARAARTTVYESFDPEDGIGFGGSDLEPHLQAMFAAALAERLNHPDAALKPVDLEFVRAAIDAAWSSVPSQQQVTLLPWIGWAEIAYANAAHEPIQNAEALVELRDVLNRTRNAVEATLPLDLRGGYPLATGTSAPPRPTAQTSRPAAFFSTMLRVPELTPPDQVAAAAEGHRETMRFLIQLSVRESHEWSLRNPRAALGGIRVSTWETRLPTAAQAMALLAAVETLQSLPAVRGDQ